MKNLSFVLRRIRNMIPVLLAVSLLTFALGSISSGDTARMIAEKEFGRPSTEQIKMVHLRMGFDRPMMEQYLSWLSKAIRGNLGKSYSNGQPVVREIAALFPKTAQLAGWALLFTLFFSFSLGLLSVLQKGRWIERIIRVFCFFSVSMPGFWLALLVLYFFGARLGYISVLGSHDQGVPLLPALVMSISGVGVYVQLVKTSMEEVLEKGYIRSARAKGVSEWKIIGVHGLKNAALPVLNKLGMGFSSMLAGSAVMESIFSLNGLGKYALESVKLKDFPVVQGFVLFIALLVILINLSVDLISCILDPRLRLRT